MAFHFFPSHPDSLKDTHKLYYLKYCLAISLSVYFANSYLKLTHLHSTLYCHEAVTYQVKFQLLSPIELHGFS